MEVALVLHDRRGNEGMNSEEKLELTKPNREYTRDWRVSID